MILTRHQTPRGPRWACDRRYLPADFSLADVLAGPAHALPAALNAAAREERAAGPLLAPIEDTHEVWAAGVTYLSSRLAREAESEARDVYQKVYDAERPELFFKSLGWRAVGPDGDLRQRADSTWNVPEPELTLVLTATGEIVGYTVGNDLSSRDIEGENPLYLPQAKIFDGSCSLGPGIRLLAPGALRDLQVSVVIERTGTCVFMGETRTSQMKRGFEELAGFLFRELSFPHGVFLMTGTGIVPEEDFTLHPGDSIRITIGELVLKNRIAT